MSYGEGKRGLDANLEIRRLPPRALFGLVQILEYGDSWKQLMAVIPKNPNTTDMKYRVEHVKLIEYHGNVQKRPCAEIFLDEWGTSGRKRPTVAFLLEMLIKADLYRAAEYVAADLLQDTLPERPKYGPAAAIDLSDEALEKHLPPNENTESSPSVDDLIHLLPKPFEGLMILSGSNDQSQTPHQDEVNSNNRLLNGTASSGSSTQIVTELPTARIMTNSSSGNEQQSHACHDVPRNISPSVLHFPYCDLEKITYGFCEMSVTADTQRDGGCKLGTGAFGSVFLGVLPSGKVAVKKLNTDAINVEKQFENEIQTLSRFRHDNLLPLLGYSCDGPNYCLVYEYMSNGSLQEKLADKGSMPVLNWKTRVNIALGTSNGIYYLHSAFEKPLIHRDIKSANILLNDSLHPKLGDFGLVHLGSGGQQSQSVLLTSTVFGTSAYMAPEAFRGDVSVKLDTFSFGVVLLELLTSLPPYDENREGCDLVTHVDGICDASIEPLLDTSAGSWVINNDGDFKELNVSEHVYTIALKCLEEKRLRPNMEYVLKQLEQIAELLPLADI